MASVELALAGVAVAASSWVVLRELRPPRPPHPPKPARPRRAEAPATGQVEAAPVEAAPVRAAAAEMSVVVVDPVDLTEPRDTPAQPARAAASMLEELATVETDAGPPLWRRVSSAMALLVMTLAVAGAMGAGIYRGLLALKP